MPYPTAITPLASAARTAGGAGASIDLRPADQPPRFTAALRLAVSAVAGTLPTLDVTVETSEDGVVWRTLGAFPQRTGVGAVRQRFPGADRYLRAVWALGGTLPNFTFGVSGEAIFVLATPADLARKGLSAEALAPIPVADQDEALCSSSATALKIFGNRYKLPLRAWTDDIVTHVCQMAAADLMVPRGLGPEDARVLMGQKAAALVELRTIGNEESDPQEGIVDSSPDEYDGAGGFAESDPPRGW